MKHRSDNPIGAAAPLPQSKLPTYGDVARQWRQTRVDMLKATPGKHVSNREVAKQVCFEEDLLSWGNRSTVYMSICWFDLDIHVFSYKIAGLFGQPRLFLNFWSF